MKHIHSFFRGLGATVSEMKKEQAEQRLELAKAKSELQMMQEQQSKDYGELKSEAVAERTALRTRLDYLVHMLEEERAARLSGANGHGAAGAACRQTENHG